ncbi:MAG: type IV secretion system DNA-binding domain-containing protein [Pirellulales bacterium]|nr:type IV secretion system DNA-binding domain-containing protein [Pirellulales bacterium]
MNSFPKLLNHFWRRSSTTTPTDAQTNGPGSADECLWFGVDLPFREATSHCMLAGATGSGKTTMLRLFMQGVLPRIGPGSGQRALVYDAKGDLMSLLPAISPASIIKTTNPFDARGVAWNLHRDVREPRVALQIAFTLIPEEQESQPFFSNAARHLMYGVMLSYILSGVEWTFADLMRGLDSSSRLRKILERHDVTRSIVSNYFHDPRLLSNIMSTIATKLLPFHPIAAAWEHATEKISLEEWATNEMILLLGNSETSRKPIDAINRCMFRRACEIVLQQNETLQPRTWFFLDELSEAGRLDGLVSLLKKGRSKGASVTLCFQSISGLRDSRLYGPHLTDEILGQIGNRFFGRLECPETAEWASRLFGDQVVDQFTTSRTTSGQGSSTTENQQIVTRRAVLPVEFMSIPPCDATNGLTAYFMVRSHGCFRTNFAGHSLFNGDLVPPAPGVPELVPRSVEAQYLLPWSTQQRLMFCGPVAKKPDKRSQRQKRKPDLDQLDEMDTL